ncbi:peptidoglycan-associated lipoprotein Pal [Thalassomonas sp. RHCl1]|uniref:peptidoglycan-associated lipoprotein Pal n=1 Tax=Thalassomonas sp. RHCl1 TaxID=2995320 RepID=UPI00248C1CDC|nr:peptidoglycan-associated lipoprotein Pal [Thalassomonas sp. RHCl1]
MRLNKTVKSLAVALPMFALAACSSSSDTDSSSQVDTNTGSSSSVSTPSESNVQVTAAQRAAEIAEQRKREQLEQLRSEHIIYFDFDVSNIKSDFAQLLDAHAKFLNENPNVNVLIEGHADERGTPEYNIALGERRAKSVVTYLENMGVASSQLTTVSYGEEKPMVKDRTEAAFAKNRRAVLVY